MGSSRSEQACARLDFPVLVQGVSSGRCAPRRPLASPCPREQSQERQGAAADSAANFHAESPWAWLAIPSDWAHDCGIHCDLGALPNGESIGDNFYAASVAGWYVSGGRRAMRLASLQMRAAARSTRNLFFLFPRTFFRLPRVPELKRLGLQTSSYR